MQKVSPSAVVPHASVRAGSLGPTCDPGAEVSSGWRASSTGLDAIRCRGGFRKFCAKSGPRLLPSPQAHDPLRLSRTLWRARREHCSRSGPPP